MFITLTNIAPAHKDKQVVLNSDIIVSMFAATVTREAVDEEPAVVEDVTFIHCPPHGTWEVKESMSEVTKRLNGDAA
jgi:hypothetical protein